MSKQLHRTKDQGFAPSSIFFHFLKKGRINRKIKIETEGKKWIKKINDKNQ